MALRANIHKIIIKEGARGGERKKCPRNKIPLNNEQKV